MSRNFENISLINLIDFDNKVHFISKDIISINDFEMRSITERLEIYSMLSIRFKIEFYNSLHVQCHITILYFV